MSSIIDAPITISSLNLPRNNNLYETEETFVDLRGSVSPRLSTRVVVNGKDATYDRGLGTWRINQFSLLPGINHLTAVALDELGHVLSSDTISIRVINANTQEVSGTLVADVTFPRAQGPYLIRDLLRVPPFEVCPVIRSRWTDRLLLQYRGRRARR